VRRQVPSPKPVWTAVGRDVEVAEALFVRLLQVGNLTFSVRVGGIVEVTVAQRDQLSPQALYFDAEWPAAPPGRWEGVPMAVYFRRASRPALNLSDGQARYLEVVVSSPSRPRRVLSRLTVRFDPAWLEAAGEGGLPERFSCFYEGLAVFLPRLDQEWTRQARDCAAASGIPVVGGRVELGVFNTVEMEFEAGPEEFLQRLLLTALIRAHFHARLTLPGLPQPLLDGYRRRHRTRFVVAEPAAPSPAAATPPRPLATLQSYLARCGLYYPIELLATYYLSLQTKPLVILTGLSGTGKTKLAQGFADLLTGGNPEQQAFVAVRPDWLDSRGLLGYFNPLTGTYQATECLRLLLRAEVNGRLGIPLPFFLILDEMNLARVEHYFADFLSAMESRRWDEAGHLRQEPLRLHDHRPCVAEAPFPRSAQDAPYFCPDYAAGPAGSCRLRPQCPLVRTLRGEPRAFIPPEVGLSPQVYITGTVNVDETTYAFSPKVLDRANTIELQAGALEAYFGAEEGSFPDEAERIALQQAFTRGGRFTSLPRWEDLSLPELVPYREQLAALNRVLEPHGLHLGYRVVTEVLHYLRHAVELLAQEEVRLPEGSGERPMTCEDAFDLQLCQKVLPRLRGPVGRLEPLLRALRALWQGPSDGPRYPRAVARIDRLLEEGRWTGYVN
jgi:hypothetical protein